MALFRKKPKEETEELEFGGDLQEQLAAMSIEELLQAPEVQYARREAAKSLGNRSKMIKRHLEVIHEPGGIEHVKATADFMELGSARPYLDALSDIAFNVEEQLLTGADVFTIWTVTGTHTGELCGLPPSGERVTIRGITMSVIKEDVVATEYTYWDFPPLTQQLMSAAPA